MAIKKKLIITLTLLPFITHANSNGEELKYFDIKNKYKQSDSELNEIYSHQIKQYKKESGSFYGGIVSEDILLKNTTSMDKIQGRKL